MQQVVADTDQTTPHVTKVKEGHAAVADTTAEVDPGMIAKAPSQTDLKNKTEARDFTTNQEKPLGDVKGKKTLSKTTKTVDRGHPGKTNDKTLKLRVKPKLH